MTAADIEVERDSQRVRQQPNSSQVNTRDSRAHPSRDPNAPGARRHRRRHGPAIENDGKQSLPNEKSQERTEGRQSVENMSRKSNLQNADTNNKPPSKSRTSDAPTEARRKRESQTGESRNSNVQPTRRYRRKPRPETADGANQPLSSNENQKHAEKEVSTKTNSNLQNSKTIATTNKTPAKAPSADVQAKVLPAKSSANVPRNRAKENAESRNSVAPAVKNRQKIVPSGTTDEVNQPVPSRKSQTQTENHISTEIREDKETKKEETKLVASGQKHEIEKPNQSQELPVSNSSVPKADVPNNVNIKSNASNLEVQLLPHIKKRTLQKSASKYLKAPIRRTPSNLQLSQQDDDNESSSQNDKQNDLIPKTPVKNDELKNKSKPMNYNSESETEDKSLVTNQNISDNKKVPCEQDVPKSNNLKNMEDRSSPQDERLDYGIDLDSEKDNDNSTEESSRSSVVGKLLDEKVRQGAYFMNNESLQIDNSQKEEFINEPENLDFNETGRANLHKLDEIGSKYAHFFTETRRLTGQPLEHNVICELDDAVEFYRARNANKFIAEEYKTITSLTARPDSYLVATSKNCSSLNIDKTFLPYDENRVRILNTDNISSGNDYICASFIKDPILESTFIITQAPMKRTIESFWAMIYEKGCREIYCLDPSISSPKANVKYWPKKGKSLIYKNYVITVEIENSNSDYDQRSIKITPNNSDEQPVILQHYSAKKKLDKPSHHDALNKLIGFACEEYYASNKHPIAVYTRAGSGLSPVFVATVMVRMQIKGAKMFSPLITSHIIRYQLMNSFNEKRFYIMLYDLVADYISVSYQIERDWLKLKK